MIFIYKRVIFLTNINRIFMNMLYITSLIHNLYDLNEILLKNNTKFNLKFILQIKKNYFRIIHTKQLKNKQPL